MASPGDAVVQREAEPVIVNVISSQLGKELRKTRVDLRADRGSKSTRS